MQERLEALEFLLKQFQVTKNQKMKLELLEQSDEVCDFLKHHEAFTGLISKLSSEEKVAVISVLAIGQGPHLFNKDIQDSPAFRDLVKTLIEIERAYDVIGGIIGYQIYILKLIVVKQSPSNSENVSESYFHPPGLNLSKDTLEVRRAIRWGIEGLSSTAEIYPVGGAGDRLDLHDEITKEALPAAILSFCGKSLLEGLIRDLQGREYLHYKLMGQQLEVPIAMMTSHEKNNHLYITRICNERQWFGRSPDSFRLFVQPLVPVVTIHGDWVMLEPLKPMLKPGGHGVIWKLAEDEGVLDWLIATGHDQALVRQINNPIAGTDHGLCAFQGLGRHNGNVFGFASCFRLLNTAEGMDVLIETPKNGHVEYRITNIEYTEFEQRNVKDLPEVPGSPYSVFPANTNILCVDLLAIKKAVKTCPIPGMLINMKSKVSHVNAEGYAEEVLAGRLESTMQNIADYIVDCYPKRLENITSENLKTFVTYNDRRKTISVTKKSYIRNESLAETPEGCFYDLLQNNGELLSQYCKMQLPPLGTDVEYMQKGPGYLVLFHPTLGPLYSVIAQKIQNGVLANGAELQLEIAELDLRDLDLDGSLLIFADSLMGHRDEKGQVRYSEKVGKCILRGVIVRNKGVSWSDSKPFWKQQLMRHESMRIILRGNAEFFAENVTFTGMQEIEVPDGHRMVASMRDGKVHFALEKIAVPTWYWKYAFDLEDRIVLQKVSC